MELLKPAKNLPNPNEWMKEVNKEYEEREAWKNDTYTVHVNRHQKIGLRDDNGDPVLMTWLSIKRNDRQAKPDWRDFQWIKNQLVGEENEGCELFPAESRLIDGANQFHIWVFEDPTYRFPFGFTDGRIVTEKKFFGETQRKFPYSRRPKDLAACEERLQQEVDKMKSKVQTNGKG